MGNNLKPKKINFSLLIYICLLVSALIYMIFFTDIARHDYSDEVISLSKGWVLVSNGERMHFDVDKLSASQYGDSASLNALLPLDESLYYDKDLCFWSDNARFHVFIDGKEVYSYEPVANITGNGYGRAYHTVQLTKEDAGKSIDIELKTVFDDHTGGKIGGFSLANGINYTRYVAERLFPACCLSVLIIFFGLLMVAIFLWIPDKSALPYDVGKLGISALLGGVWSLSQSGIMQLLTGRPVGYRIIEYFALVLLAYPLSCFVNSVTRLKRKIYPRIALAATILMLSFQLFMRLVNGTDMHRLLPFNSAMYVAIFVMEAYMLFDNERYCRRNGIPVNLRYFYTGGMAFVIGSIIDIAIYFNDNPITQNGTFMRVGLCAWVIAMLLQFLIWWAGEHVIIERERALQKKLFGYSYKDALTGIGNRRAMEDFEKNSLDVTKPFGFVMCDINGLKHVNDTKGHDAGDVMITDVADSLKSVFGVEHVFRYGGDEFMVYALETDEESVRADIEKASAIIESKGHSASFGSIYCTDPLMSLRDIKKKADSLMYDAKRKYYQGREDRRR